MQRVAYLLLALVFFQSMMIFGTVLFGKHDVDLYTTNAKGQLERLFPWQPTLGGNLAMKSFVTEALENSFRFGSDQYGPQLEFAKFYYTPEGHALLMGLVQQLGLAEIAQQPGGTPWLLNTKFANEILYDDKQSGVYDKTSVWVYKVSLVHEVQTQEGIKASIPRTYQIGVRQVDSSQRGLGVAIYSIKTIQ